MLPLSMLPPCKGAGGCGAERCSAEIFTAIDKAHCSLQAKRCAFHLTFGVICVIHKRVPIWKIVIKSKKTGCGNRNKERMLRLPVQEGFQPKRKRIKKKPPGKPGGLNFDLRLLCGKFRALFGQVIIQRQAIRIKLRFCVGGKFAVSCFRRFPNYSEYIPHTERLQLRRWRGLPLRSYRRGSGYRRYR